MVTSKEHITLSYIYKRYFDRYLDELKTPISLDVFKAVNQTLACRTARIGVNIYQCPSCLETKHVLRSCKNRFCPRCGYADTQKWALDLSEKVAPCSHHHIVFTLPATLRQLGKNNKDKVHSILLAASAETMITWFKAKHNCTPGIINVLHTAGSDQKYHPHAHMICSAGGITDDKQLKTLKNQWYLINQKFLAKKFRWHFNRLLIQAFRKDELITPYDTLNEFKSFIKTINSQKWIVNVQPPLKKPHHIVNYVGRYTKRACISEYNIISADNDFISFRHKDYKQTDKKGKPKLVVTSLRFDVFLARLFQHVPSKGFRAVRYYGMYTNVKFATLKEILNRTPTPKNKKDWRTYQINKTGIDPLMCPCCKLEMEHRLQYYDQRPRNLRWKIPCPVPDHWK